MGLFERIKQQFGKEYEGIHKCVIAYSGGLDTMVIASIMQDMGIEVVTLTLEMGQKGELKNAVERAKRLGVKKTYAIDTRKEFAEDFISHAIKANSLYEGIYPNATALGRPLIVKHLVQVAEKEKCQAVAHGSTGKGNDQIRFDNGITALDPSLRVIAPVRDWELWRDEEVAYAKERGIEVSAESKTFSIDENLWGRSIEAGPIEQIGREVPEEAYAWTVSPEKAPDKPSYVKISFEKGEIMEAEILDSGRKVKDKAIGALEAIEKIHKAAAENGVGRMDHMEDRVVGFKSREAYEAPAASVIIPAHQEMEKAVLTKDELLFKETADRQWSELVYRGQWYSPLRESLSLFQAELNKPVSGNVTVKLYKGSARVVARESRNALYSLSLASYDKKATNWSQRDGAVFTRLFGLQNAMAYQLRKKANR